jgi:hypothetical protein
MGQHKQTYIPIDQNKKSKNKTINLQLTDLWQGYQKYIMEKKENLFNK